MVPETVMGANGSNMPEPAWAFGVEAQNSTTRNCAASNSLKAAALCRSFVAYMNFCIVLRIAFIKIE